ncbi:hypothetical protein HAV22_10595 [Massilia sp. TW-1]|uniref:TonB C-terminal domain-containing protein n=1 Tax=Telluria antibiotica TaxID=2717319 RepID=A0ABX0PA35_9BURK|nr:hypothetical protein [Telluria antibiotica]NIA54091.1 hypothetical protein [Telluria antibiotica]
MNIFFRICPLPMSFASTSKALLAVALACTLGCAQAATAPEFSDDMRTLITQGLRHEVVRIFTLDKDLPLDPALRAAAEKIAEEHVARFDKLLPVWLSEEAALESLAGKAPSFREASSALLARLLNELALWQLEPGDAHYETATLTALRNGPDACYGIPDSLAADFTVRILRIQALPAGEREAMLASERQLLTHWGQARANLAPWPDPLPQEAAYALLRRGPPAGDHPRLALPPGLASDVMGKGADYAALQPGERCVLQHWWVRESLRQGIAPAAVLNAFRYGTMLTAVARYGSTFDKSGAATGKDVAGPPPYPSVAKFFAVTGVTTVSVQLDRDGNPLQASVIGRKIQVPGIRGVRPVAFENAFDDAIVKYAMQEDRHYHKPSGDAPFKFQMVWNLDDDTDAKASKGTKQ